MSAVIQCHNCSARLAIKSAEKGRIRCPRCKQVIVFAEKPAPSESVSMPNRSKRQRTAKKKSRSKVNWLLWGGLGIGGLVISLLLVIVVLLVQSRPDNSNNIAENVEGSDTNAASFARPEVSESAVAAAQENGGEPYFQAAPNAVSAPPVPYAWNDGDVYEYEIQVTAEFPDKYRIEKIDCHYEVLQRGLASTTRPGGEASGSGFVVSTDGVIATCAHVVEGATDIRVELGDQRFSGRVIALNPEVDLALVKIEAARLTPLPLARGRGPELGEEIRAFGFPMHSVLGSDLKVNRGTVSGVSSAPDDVTFQIDAAINPGNSGGPVIDPRGNVLGIASAKLSGQTVSQIGFAVLAESLRSLMADVGTPITPPKTQDYSSPTEMIKDASKSMAFLKVMSGRDDAKVTELRYRHSSEAHYTGSTGLRYPKILNERQSSIGHIRVNEWGEVDSWRPSEQANGIMPYLLGPLANCVIEPLPRYAQGLYSSRQPIVLMRESRLESSSPFLFRFGDIRLRELIPAMVTHKIQREQTEGDLVTFHKTYECKSLDNPSRPETHVKIEGSWVFDKQRGIPVSARINGNYEHNAPTITHRIPIEITLRLKGADESKAAEEKRQQVLAGFRSQDQARRSPATPEEQKQLLADLTSGDERREKQAISTMQIKPPGTPDDAIARELMTRFTQFQKFDSDFEQWMGQNEIAGALKLWATPALVPDVIVELKAERISGNLEVFLPSIQSDSYFPAMTDVLRKDAKRGASLFGTQGSLCEDALLALLDDVDVRLGSAIIGILRDVGTSKSGEKLAQYESGSQYYLQARTAASAIAGRKGAPVASISPPGNGAYMTPEMSVRMTGLTEVEEAQRDFLFGEGRKMFTEMHQAHDTNKDGVIDRSEGSPKLFTTYDKNNDGKITLEEMLGKLADK